MLSSIETRTVKDYLTLQSDEERLQFICNSFGLKKPKLIGKIEINSIGRYKITNFLNPINGEKIPRVAEDAAETEFVFYDEGKKDNLIEDDYVTFDFVPNPELKEKKIKSRGDVIKIVPGSVKKFNPIYSITSGQIGINIKDIEVEALVKVDKNFDSTIYYANNIYSDLIDCYIKNTIDEFDKRELAFDQNVINENKRINEKNQELLRREQDLDDSQEMLLKKENQLWKMADFLKELGFKIEEDVEIQDIEDSSQNKIKVNEVNLTILKQIQAKIYKQSGEKLWYDINYLQNILVAISTDQLVVLHGASGTGKTSIVSALAKSINANYKIIPVQSSWIDRQDLFGYYNPLSKMYLSTPFLDAILEAKKEQNKDKFYLICLDELNLSQVEYYFADLLSLREQNEEIPLYSEQEYNYSLEEVKWFLQRVYNLQSETEIANIMNEILKIDDKDQLMYMQRYKNLMKFKPSLSIPDNVRFIGTMNIDGTTKPLSPKVIDRSYFIELKKSETSFNEDIEFKDIHLTPNDFEVINKMSEVGELEGNLLAHLQACNVEINPRTKKHLSQITHYFKLICSENEEDKLNVLDELLNNKILPKINYYISNDDTNHIKLKDKIEEFVGEESKSYKKVQKMVNNAESTKVFSYWG
ncbi:AAA family ATPase [Metabacillus endolithicus]|uniref:AAA family ATPase n=1 Tax=Metabacillus endolithicus TaxID=1535204 RepID=A0ABW5C0F6_9BACI